MGTTPIIAEAPEPGACADAQRAGSTRLEKGKRNVVVTASCLVATILLALMVPASSSAERSSRLALTMDHVLVRADFIGEIEVLDAAPAGDLYEARARVVSRWFSRWPSRSHLDIRTRPDFGGIRHLVQGADAIVLLSGGAWRTARNAQR